MDTPEGTEAFWNINIENLEGSHAEHSHLEDDPAKTGLKSNHAEYSY